MTWFDQQGRDGTGLEGCTSLTIAYFSKMRLIGIYQRSVLYHLIPVKLLGVNHIDILTSNSIEIVIGAFALDPSRER